MADNKDVEIGCRIKFLRERLEMTQEELAQKLGYRSKSSVNKIELGINGLTQSKILDVANALQTTPEVIMCWKDCSEESCKLLGTCKSANLDSFVSLLAKLDDFDRGLIMGEIRSLINSDKYSVKKELKES